MINTVVIFFLLFPMGVLILIAHSIAAMKLERKYSKIMRQQVQELELRIVHFKKEKKTYLIEFLNILIPALNFEEKHSYYLILHPHDEVEVSEQEFINLSGKRFVKVIRQELTISPQNPWFLRPWLFTLFNPEIIPKEKSIVKYRLL